MATETPAALPDADRLARGALLQQGAQVVRMAGGLLVLTVLARELSLAELGTYTLLLSLITYVQFVIREGPRGVKVVLVRGLAWLGAGSLTAFRLGKVLQSSIRSRWADQGVVRCSGGH